MKSIAICATDFGFGSGGKLSSICARFDGYDVIILGSKLSHAVWQHCDIKAWYPDAFATPDTLGAIVEAENVGVAIAILEPDAVRAVQNGGIPCIYVDSIPFLWQEKDPVPFDADLYCAQLAPWLPLESGCVLDRVQRLQWVGAILPEPSRGVSMPRAQELCLINVGGLHSPFDDAGSVYLELIIEPVIRAARRAGFPDIRMVGNIGRYQEQHQNVSSGTISHAQFQELLASAGLLITSPGLTTILEAQSKQTPRILLPPQNVSQILNSRLFATSMGTELAVEWPAELMDDAAVLASRSGGEEAALRVMYGSIRKIDASQMAWLENDVSAAIEAAQERVDGWARYIEATGTGGARQIADMAKSFID